MNKANVWAKIKAYKFENLVHPSAWDQLVNAFGGDDPSYKAFLHKIAKKLNWNEKFAAKAIAEYKKFVYLAVTSDFDVTPSKAIDMVWHEHLLFTGGYRTFCEKVLGRNLDHNPEFIPSDEQTGVFNAQYMATIELYKKEFNMDAPDDVWGWTKFNPKNVPSEEYEPVKKKKNDYASDSSSNDIALFMLLQNDSSYTDNHAMHHDFGGFDGGHTGGGGAAGTLDSPSITPDTGISVPDFSATPDSISVSDSAPSCSSSSCSSSCGGGGGGD